MGQKNDGKAKRAAMNYYSQFDWERILNSHKTSYPENIIEEYHRILSGFGADSGRSCGDGGRNGGGNSCTRGGSGHGNSGDTAASGSYIPPFLQKYLNLPMLARLKNIGLLCGSDWTPLFKNRFFYSRYDHSLGVALIIWHFTHDKAQTLAGLFHDLSTPVFSHVSDFRKGDALTQTATEGPNETIIRGCRELGPLLAEDGLTYDDIVDYHKYPVADNEIPQLSADRLEYMFPSGMVMEGSWTLEEIKKCYDDLEVLTFTEKDDGDGGSGKKTAGGAGEAKGAEGTAKNSTTQELGFKTLETAELYCQKFCMTGHILQLNEDKLTLHLLGQIMNLAVELGILQEDDFMNLGEREIIEKIDGALSETDKFCTASATIPESDVISTRAEGSTANSANTRSYFSRLYHTFRTMTKIEHTDSPLSSEEYFCISLKVKQRYINPLVRIDKELGNAATVGNDTTPVVGTNTSTTTGATAHSTFTVARLSEVSPKCRKLIEDFLSFSDTVYGCVKLSDE